MADQRLRFIAEWVDRGLKRGAQEAKEAAKSISDNWDDAKKTIGTFTAAAAAAGVALKKTYDIAKQGANIELAAQRFDRLSASIGTTGDALRDDLADATDGLMSDAEQMQLAGELMSLGLVKTHDEAVRLTSVASQLGMNMNQLVLTLTNRTTMRFDALGVAVDGFDEKVKALEQSGLSAEEAFTEAFLQQAEEQIERVGGIADTAAGDFMKFEAATKNLGDAMKLWLARNTSDAFEAMALLITWGDRMNDMYQEAEGRILDTAESYDEYIERAIQAQVVAGELNGRQAVRIQHLIDEGNLTEDLAVKLGLLSEAEWDKNDALQAAIQYEGRREELVKASTAATEEAIEAQEALAVSLDDANDNIVRQIEGWKEDIEWIEHGGLAIQDYADAIRTDYENNVLSATEATRRFDQAIYDAIAITAEINNMSLEDIRKEFEDAGFNADIAAGKAQEVWDKLQQLDGSESYASVFVNEYHTIYKKSGSDPGRATGFSGYIRNQTGGSYAVPSMYSNDTFNVGGGLYATAGERVDITPASQSREDEIASMFSQQSPKKIGKAIARELMRNGAVR